MTEKRSDFTPYHLAAILLLALCLVLAQAASLWALSHHRSLHPQAHIDGELPTLWLIGLASLVLALLLALVICFSLRPGLRRLRRDLLRLQQTEAALRQSEHHLRLTLQAAHTGTWEWQLAQGTATWSDETYRLTGYEPGTVCPGIEAWLQAAHPDDRDRIHARGLAALEQRAGLDLEFRVIHPDQSVRWLQSVGQMVFDAQGQPVAMVGIQFDITDRKRLEQELRQNEQRLRLILRAARAATWETRFTTGQTIWSDEMYHMMGLAPGTVLDSPTAWMQNILPADRDRLSAYLIQVFAEQSDIDFEFRVVQPDGSIRWIQSIGQVQSVSPGYPTTMIGIQFDITQRKQLEADLRRSEERLRLITDNMTDIVAQFNVDGTPNYVSPSVQSVLGYTSEFWMSLSEADRINLIHPADRERVVNDILGVITSGLSARTEYRYRRADGHYTWVESVYDPIRSPEGAITGLVVAVRDISRRKQTEGNLQGYTREIEALYHFAPCGYHSLDADGYLIRINNTELQWLGYTREELVGKRFVDLLTPTSRLLFQQKFAEMLEHGLVRDVEYELVRKDGGILNVLLNSTAVWSEEDGSFIMTRASIFDITDRKRIETAEREQRALAEALRDTAAALNSTLDLDEVLDRILVNLERVLPHDASNIILLDSGTMRIVRARGYEALGMADSIRSFNLPLSAVPDFERMARTRQVQIIPDINQYANWVTVEGFSVFRSTAGAPICIEDETIGFLNLDSLTPGFFSSRHAEGLRAFADQAALAIQNARLYRQAQELATYEERQRLARELHDAVSQMLFSASLVAETLPRLWQRFPDEVPAGLAELQRLTRGALAEMRSLLFELRPNALATTDMAALLRHLVDAAMGHTQAAVTLSVQGQPSLPYDVHIALYRIAQEALSNIVKHARASQIVVQLSQNEDGIELLIRDNGRGFDPAGSFAGHFGLSIMRERAAAVGAWLMLDSQPANGTTVRLTWSANQRVPVYGSNEANPNLDCGRS